MALIDEILQAPSYGWQDGDGHLSKPSNKQLLKEAVRNINVLSDKRRWMPFMSWCITLSFLPFFFCFVYFYFSLTLLFVFLFYSTVIMSTHSTIWFHRYCTHKAYTFKNSIWRIIVQNLVIKSFPEELYVLSHHVHHAKSDRPGDPYNAGAGLMYCFLADVNHQLTAKNLTREKYYRARRLLSHTGVLTNTYGQYKKWGTITSLRYATGVCLINWVCWYGIAFFLSGHALACTLFGAAMFWMIFVRMFNYTGHGKGRCRHIEGVDFDGSNLSVNQLRPGFFAGEWHNNHHLFPGSARAGFLPYQIDIAWIFIYLMFKVNIVSSYHDSKKAFIKKYQRV